MTTDNEKGPLNQMESGQEKRSASEARALSEIVNGTPSENLCQRGCPAPEQASETAAQQPAQADARVGLTDEQREAIQRAIDYADMSDRDSDAEALRPLLATPLPEPRAEVTDDKTTRLIKTLSDIIHDQTIAMQSAIIEWQHGKGAEAGLSWIVNTLAGPGHLPDFDAPHGKHAQFWFNANQANPLPACFCGNPSSSLWMGQGFCCDEHYRETKAKYDADH